MLASMGEVSTIGLDIAKAVFQVHGVDGSGTVVIRKRVSRVKMLEFFSDLPPCLVGIEACPSAHHWGRQLQLLGHTVKLMPPSYVKAYLKRSKNDANDAAAICEAVTGPSAVRRRDDANDALRSGAGQVGAWSWLKAWAMKIARHRGMKKAIVALARRLAVIMHRIWVDGTEFRWAQEETAAA